MKVDTSTECMAEVLRRVPAGSSAIDIGCGTGSHSAAMVAHGLDVTAVDISPKPDGLACAFIRSDVFNLDLPDQFDLVWSSHVMEHVDCPLDFLIKLRSLCRPGGTIAVTVPPLKHTIVPGHLTLWNTGLLMVHMLRAGITIKGGWYGQHGYNVSVIGKNTGMKPCKSWREIVAGLPDGVCEQGAKHFNGQINGGDSDD